MTRAVQVVVMGVSATGKTSVGELLAERLGCAFVEGDSYHPQANIEKMSLGIPLTDEDREPWLKALATALSEAAAEGRSTVLTCSSLRRSYRDLLRTGGHDLFFVFLNAPFDVLVPRMSERTKHFMPTSLLESQFDTLEPPAPDEAFAEVDVTPPVGQVVDEAERAVRAHFGI